MLAKASARTTFKVSTWHTTRARTHPQLEMNRDTAEIPSIIADLEKNVVAMQESQYVHLHIPIRTI